MAVFPQMARQCLSFAAVLGKIALGHFSPEQNHKMVSDSIEPGFHLGQLSGELLPYLNQTQWRHK